MGQDPRKHRPLDLIVVEDSPVDVELMADTLRVAGLIADVRRVGDEPSFRAALDERLPDAILADWTLLRFSGRRSLEIARERCPDVPFIFVSGTILESTVIEALRQGATDYVYKHQLQQLGPALIRALDEAQAQRALYESAATYRSLFDNMLNGFACCQMLFENGQPQDFIYLSVNKAFETQTGLKNVVGRKVSEVIPGIRESDPILFETYGRVAMTGQPEHFETYVEAMRMWFSISVYSPKREYFVAVFDVITERKLAEQAVERERSRLEAILKTASDGIHILDAEGLLIDANDAFLNMLGYDRTVIGRLHVTDWDVQMDGAAVRENLKKHIGWQDSPPLRIQTRHRCSDDRIIDVEIDVRGFDFDGKGYLCASSHDITERKAAEVKIQRLTQLYAALSQCNQAIVRCSCEEDLFPQICHVAVQFGGFKMAWIGLADPDTLMVRPTASFGEGIEYLQGIEISLDPDSPFGRSPTATAIREDRPFWCQNFTNDPVTAPWHERSAPFSWGGMASLPLHRNDGPIGAFIVYTDVANAFDEAARELLVEMAADISFALDSFDRATRRKQAELDLTTSERHFHSLFENMLEGYAHCKMLFREGVAEEFVYLEVNHAFEALTGLKDVTGKRASEVIPGIRESNPELIETFSRVALSGLPEQFEMYVAGLARWFSIAVYCPEKEHIVVIFDNITEHKQSEQVLAESEQRFRGLVEQSLAGTYIVQDGRFAYVNPRLAEIFGYASASELIGVEALSLVAEQDRDRIAENIRNRIENEVQSINYDFTAVRKDGSLINIGAHGARATHAGRPAIIGLMQDVSEKVRDEERIQHYVKQLEEAFMQTVGVATALVELRDPYTAGHEERVAQIAVALGTGLGLDAHRIEGLRVGGYIHDIGKIIIPAEILSKPGRLSAIEYELVKGHPQAGYDILKNVKFPWPVADIAYQHHERLDGSGYPRGLKGEEILLEARIMAVADVVEAMSSHRPYRPGLGIEEALAEIGRGSGSLYDPAVAGACLQLFREKGYVLPNH